MGYFRQYLIVGGIPEAVQTFVTANSHKKGNNIISWKKINVMPAWDWLPGKD